MRDLINAIKVIEKYNSMDSIEFQELVRDYIKSDVTDDDIDNFRFSGLNNIDFFKYLCDGNKSQYEDKLHNIILIPKYQYFEGIGEWQIIKYDKYVITYILHKKNKFRVIVNDKLTDEVILFNVKTYSFKNTILSAISKYRNNILMNDKTHINTLSLKWFLNSNNDMMKHNVSTHLLPIRKELNRDKLTEFNLI